MTKLRGKLKRILGGGILAISLALGVKYGVIHSHYKPHIEYSQRTPEERKKEWEEYWKPVDEQKSRIEGCRKQYLQAAFEEREKEFLLPKSNNLVNKTYEGIDSRPYISFLALAVPDTEKQVRILLTDNGYFISKRKISDDNEKHQSTGSYNWCRFDELSESILMPRTITPKDKTGIYCKRPVTYHNLNIEPYELYHEWGHWNYRHLTEEEKGKWKSILNNNKKELEERISSLLWMDSEEYYADNAEAFLSGKLFGGNARIMHITQESYNLLSSKFPEHAKRWAYMVNKAIKEYRENNMKSMAERDEKIFRSILPNFSPNTDYEFIPNPPEIIFTDLTQKGAVKRLEWEVFLKTFRLF